MHIQEKIQNISLPIDPMESERLALKKMQLLVLSNYTATPFEPYFRKHFNSNGIQPTFNFSDYDNVYQVASQLKISQTDAIIFLTIDVNRLIENKKLSWNTNHVLNYFSSIINAIRSRYSVPIIISNLFNSPMLLNTRDFIGRADNENYQLVQLNASLSNMLEGKFASCYMLDLQSLIEVTGSTAAFNVKRYLKYHTPFSVILIEKMAATLSTFIQAIYEPRKKVLILDCDNTLWGGTIGEDGINGIALSEHEYPGNIFRHFQKAVLSLHASGIILAICSKNNIEDVIKVLAEHPSSILNPSHFTCIKANWKSKHENIIAIARELNVGVESIVFIDDSPTECELVQGFIPNISVLKMPSSPAEILEILTFKNYFFQLHQSDDDRIRNQTYTESKKRQSSQNQFDSIDSFLHSLNMVATIKKASTCNATRCAQLSQKTNQFNLMLKRYTEPEIMAFLNDTNNLILLLSAQDKFGHYGETGLCMIEYRAPTAHIINFLLSCRIIGKGFEQALLQEVLTTISQRKDITRIEAEFIPAEKNQQVSNFWSDNGFNSNDGTGFSVNINEISVMPLKHIKSIGMKNG